MSLSSGPREASCIVTSQMARRFSLGNILDGAIRFLASLPPDVVGSIEATLVSNWRHARTKVENDDAIYVQDPATGGGYFRGPVVSIDYDLEMLNAFIDAFLF